MMSHFLFPSELRQASDGHVFSRMVLSDVIGPQVSSLDIEGLVLLVLTPSGMPAFNHSQGFSEEQLTCYQQYRQHDVYMNRYLSSPSCWGKMQYLQQLLPFNNIRDETFLERIYPSIGFNHSVSGIRSLAYGYRLLLSCHREHRYSIKEQLALEHLLRLSCDWANHQLSLSHLQNSLAKCAKVTQGREALTDAEWQVLLLLIEGYDGSEIALLRNTAKETVRSQIKSLLRKTRSRNQNQLIARYFSDPQLFGLDLQRS